MDGKWIKNEQNISKHNLGTSSFRIQKELSHPGFKERDGIHQGDLAFAEIGVPGLK